MLPPVHKSRKTEQKSWTIKNKKIFLTSQSVPNKNESKLKKERNQRSFKLIRNKSVHFCKHNEIWVLLLQIVHFCKHYVFINFALIWKIPIHVDELILWMLAFYGHKDVVELFFDWFLNNPSSFLHHFGMRKLNSDVMILCTFLKMITFNGGSTGKQK